MIANSSGRRSWPGSAARACAVVVAFASGCGEAPESRRDATLDAATAKRVQSLAAASASSVDPAVPAASRTTFPPLDRVAEAAWSAPPPIVEAPPPPPAPVAPPFPYPFVGTMSAQAEAAGGGASGPGGSRAIVAAPTRTWIVGVGDLIDQQWRVDAVQAENLRLTYLPLGSAQTVSAKAN